jgi:lipoyl-dependent peroxiredoxin
MKTLYTAHATAVDGRNGHAQTDDNNLSVELATPGAPAKKTGKTTNPEQLFACGYAACFGSAIEAVAKMEKTPVSGVEVHSSVSLNQDEKSGYSISAELNVVIPGVDAARAEALVQKAHQICPYSKATRGNIEVVLKVNSQPIKQAA